MGRRRFSGGALTVTAVASSGRAMASTNAMSHITQVDLSGFDLRCQSRSYFSQIRTR
jgi:hypothetical protein